MKTVPSLILIVVLGIVIVVLGYADNRLPKSIHEPVAWLANKVTPLYEAVEKSPIASQTAQLSQRGSEVYEQGSKILGAAIAVDEQADEQTLTDRAIEYGRYLYCKQVVTDWERKQESTE